jgi:hypothetical protein
VNAHAGSNQYCFGIPERIHSASAHSKHVGRASCLYCLLQSVQFWLTSCLLQTPAHPLPPPCLASCLLKASAPAHRAAPARSLAWTPLRLTWGTGLTSWLGHLQEDCWPYTVSLSQQLVVVFSLLVCSVVLRCFSCRNAWVCCHTLMLVNQSSAYALAIHADSCACLCMMLLAHQGNKISAQLQPANKQLWRPNRNFVWHNIIVTATVPMCITKQLMRHGSCIHRLHSHLLADTAGAAV